MKCHYVGCKNEATMIMRNRINELYACDECAPAWAKDKNHKSKVYVVIRLTEKKN